MSNAVDLSRTARVIHEALSKTAVALGQPAYPDWPVAEEWQKKSSEAAARTIYEDPKASAGAIWRAWVKERQGAGWVYAEVTDKSNKKHSMLPKEGESLEEAFARLPFAEQIKDYVAMGAALDDLRAQGAWAACAGADFVREVATQSGKDLYVVQDVVAAISDLGYDFHLKSSGFGLLMDQHKKLQADFDALRAETGRLALQFGGARMGMPTTTAPDPAAMPTYPQREGPPDGAQ